jgi:hypothetical protein
MYMPLSTIYLIMSSYFSVGDDGRNWVGGTGEGLSRRLPKLTLQLYELQPNLFILCFR